MRSWEADGTGNQAGELTQNHSGEFSSPTVKNINIWSFLSNENPFYLISFAFLLHGTVISMSDYSSIANPWPRLGITCGYLLLCVLIVWYVVRRLHLWNDARSLLLMICLLFVELALTFDQPLLQNMKTGIALISVGLGLTSFLFELLVWLLQIRFPWKYRIPSHLMLGLLFCYPLLLHPELFHQNELSVRLQIYLFPWIAGGLILLLIPAVRAGADYMKQNGTPWAYPYYPWCWIGILIFSLAIRAFTLAMSFDPVLVLSRDEAMELPSIFGVYFLTPIILAIAFLLMATGSRSARTWGMIIPYLVQLISIQWFEGSQPYQQFVSVLQGDVGSPFLITNVSCIVFYAILALLRFQFAWEHLSVNLLLLGLSPVLGLQPGEFHQFQVLHLPLAVSAGMLFVTGLVRKSSFPVMLSAILVLGELIYEPNYGLWPGSMSVEWRFLTVCYLTLIVGIILTIFFDDGFSQMLQKRLPLLSLCLTIGVLFASTDLDYGARDTSVVVNVAGVVLVLLLIGVGILQKRKAWYLSGGLCLVISYCKWSYDLIYELQAFPGWEGIGSFLMAFVLLILALAISLLRRA